MGVSEGLKKFDAQGSVSSEFRVYTFQGAVLSVVTLLCILYLVVTEVYFNFQVTFHEQVHVNATSPRGIEMEFDISLPTVSCSHIFIDSADPTGQAQSLHLDKEHHVWKHRYKVVLDHMVLIGSKRKLELGSTMLKEEDLEETLEYKIASADGDDDHKACGSCYGAGEEGECCNACEDIRRAYKRRGWVLHDTSEIPQCKGEAKLDEQEGEGCNVHGKVALSSGGGNLHLAPGKDYGSTETGDNIFDMLLRSFQKWNVTHTVNKIRFGPEYPAAVYQLDGQNKLVDDQSAMYQYYFQVRCGLGIERVFIVYVFNNAFFYLLDCPYKVSVSQRHVDSNQPILRDGAYSSCYSRIFTRTPGHFLLLRSVSAARGDYRRLPKRIHCIFYKRLRDYWRRCDRHGDARSIHVFAEIIATTVFGNVELPK
jgi:hypothetical protein